MMDLIVKLLPPPSIYPYNTTKNTSSGGLRYGAELRPERTKAQSTEHRAQQIQLSPPNKYGVTSEGYRLQATGDRQDNVECCNSSSNLRTAAYLLRTSHERQYASWWNGDHRKTRSNKFTA